MPVPVTKTATGRYLVLDDAPIAAGMTFVGRCPCGRAVFVADEATS
jgi:hypothetical protein